MKNLKQKEGITLIALIITIIVLLILAGVTISMLTGDNGILKNAQTAAIETRGASVEEVRDIWLTEIEMAKITGGKAKTMEEILEQLQTDGLLTKEEVEIITAQENTNNEITIGSKTISFNVDYTPPEETIPDETLPDETALAVNIEATNITANSVTLTVTATNNESGIKEYQYYLGEELKETLTTNTYEYTGLTSNTEYTIGVIVIDNAGNKTEKKTTTITTEKPTVEEKLKAGNYVNYVDKNGTTRKCIVLYDTAYNTAKGTNYGIQIITVDTVENVTLGNNSNFTSSQTSYNNAISTLNTKANSYLNTTFASNARCVGSVPNNPSSESSSYFSGYECYVKNSDSNYEKDFNQLGTLNIRNIGREYWLASRNRYEDGNASHQFIRYVLSNGGLNSDGARLTCGVWSGNKMQESFSKGLRAVFTLHSTVKAIGGAGTSDSPWELGI